MQDTVNLDRLFVELEKELSALESLTARSLSELDADGSAALCRWLGDWSLLDDFELPDRRRAVAPADPSFSLSTKIK